MSHTVTVVFGGEREYEFPLRDADVASTTKDQARNWLAREFRIRNARRRTRWARCWCST